MPNARLKSLMIRDFRSISGEWTIPLDASVVLVHGQNGAGKTSLLSALELAATGTISHLDRAGDQTYQSHLHHRGTGAGQVVVHTDGLEGASSGSASLSERGADCSPLLTGQMSETFVERCFLPQATLGRLLEVYAPLDSREADTPLARFVKELLGLDALDALIDGLHASGHLARAEKLSTPWQTADARRSNVEQLLVSANRSQDVAQARVDALMSELEGRVGPSEPGESHRLDALIALADRTQAARPTRDADAARLGAALLRLDAIQSTLVQGELTVLDPNDPVTESEVQRAEARYGDWRTSRATAALDWFHASDSSTDTAGEPAPSALLRHLASAIEEDESILAEANRRLGQVDDLAHRAELARIRLTEVEIELRDVADSRSEASSVSTASALASVLVSVMEHIDGQACPVCDQEFPGSDPLRDRVRAKVSLLNTDAARFVELESRRSGLEAEQRTLVQEVAALGAQIDQANDRDAIQTEQVACSARLVHLRALEPVLQAGHLLERELARVRDEEGSASRSRILLDRCVSELADVAEVLGAVAPRGLLPQRVAALRAHAQSRLDEISNEERQSAETVRLKNELVLAIEQLAGGTAAVEKLEREVGALSQQIDEAKRRKEIGSTLRKDAEALRTATTTRVFDQHLNGSWARIFRSLVPTEPFTPQFKSIPPGSRKVTVEIETIDRAGNVAATPAAMLSQGNLNTAALSLFMALHFAVPPQLPWLIFDDPVQSMDDLHISNFAAMVKQLTRRNDRQVVIAVHQRELFEYLSLELTPASASEEQLRIVLDRTYGRSDVKVDRLKFAEDDSLRRPSPAA